jgi:NADPH:quinone reductase-like Zn-dependent oxidoreductase
MKAIQFLSKHDPLQYAEIPTPAPGRGQALIKLHYAALNHLDIWIWKEQELDKPVILGSDGSGVVVSVGPGVNPKLVGQQVIINPSLNWGDDERLFSEHYEILGNPTNGTFAEYIVIPAEYVFSKPAHLSLREAAALPLAALTAYRALFTKAKLTKDDKVLITGIGGGAALFLLQMAVATGASVYVTSSSREKIRQAVVLGAKGGFNYRDEGWIKLAKETAGGFNVIIDSAGGDGFEALTIVAYPGARIVIFGRTAGNINHLRPGVIYNKQLTIMGTVMGTSKEFASMIKFYEKYKLKPVIDREFPLCDAEKAFHYMEDGRSFGKILLSITDKADQ